MATADTLNVRIALDTAELTRGLNAARKSLQNLNKNTVSMSSAMSKNFAGVTGGIKKLGAAIASVAAARQLTQLGKQAIDAASDLTEVQNVVDTVFGDMSGTINNWSKNAMNAFGLSETSAKRFTSTMGAMFKSSGITGNALQTMSINMAALSADMASFYNLSADQAFDKIRAGISGETEPLKQLGINMSVANMEAYALSQGITKSYSAMSQAEQTILRYNYLLSVTGDAQHDFERTSGSWANQTRVLAENFNRLKTIIGQGLIAALTPLVQLLNTLIQKVIEFANAIRAAFGQQDTGGLQNTASSAADTASGLRDANAEAQKLKNTIGGFDQLNIISDDSTADMSGGISGLQPDSVYDAAAQSVDEISQKMLDLVARLKEGLQPIADLAGQIKQSFIYAFSGDNATRLMEELTRGFSAALDLIGAIADALSSAWTLDGDAFAQSISDALYNIMELANTISESLAAAFRSDAGTQYFLALLGLGAALNNVISSIAAALSAAFSNSDAGVQFFESVLSAAGSVYETFVAIGQSMANVFTSSTGTEFFAAVIAAATTFNEIISTIATTFTDVWNSAGVGDSVIRGIVETITILVDTVRGIGQRFLEAWNSAGQGENTVSAVLGMIQNVIGLVHTLADAWRTVWDSTGTTQIFSTLLSIIQRITGAVGTLAQKFSSAFSENNSAVKIFQSVQQVIQSILDYIGSIATKISDVFAGVDLSPLTDALASLAQSVANVIDAIMNIASSSANFGMLQTVIAALPGILQTVADALQYVSQIINQIDSSGILQLVSAFGSLAAVLASLGIQAVLTVLQALLAILSKIQSVISIVTSAIGNLVNAIAELVNKLADAISSLFNFNSAAEDTTSAVSGANNAVSSSSVNTARASSYRAVTATDIPQLASGGVVRSGNLFIAGERGPELVGSYGGQSAVVNNDQIVDAVSQGVAAAMQPLADSIAANDSKQTVRIRGTDLLYIMERTQRQRGNALSKNFAFGGV